MAFKFFVFATVVAVANTGLIPQHGLEYAAPVAKHTAIDDAEYDSHPQYHFNYNLEHVRTGDFKSHEESRDGDFVKGTYSVVDPDNYKRTVEYTVDPHSGFNAVVRRTHYSRPIFDPPRQTAPPPGYQQPHHH